MSHRHRVALRPFVTSLAIAIAAATMMPIPLAQGAPSAADLTKKEASEHFKAGKKLFDAKDWKGAKAEFLGAEELLPAATTEYYIARCHEELSELPDAASGYERALDGGTLGADLAKDAKTRLAALQKKPVKITIESEPSGATVRIDGTEIAQRTPFFVYIAPGTHLVVVELEGHEPFKTSIDLLPFTPQDVNASFVAPGGATTAGTTTAATTEPKATPTTTSSAPITAAKVTTTSSTGPATTSLDGSRASGARTASFITGGVAIAALGVGTIFGFRTLSDRSSFDATPTRELRDQGRRDALITDISLGLGVALAATSVVLFVTSTSITSGRTASAPSVTPIVGTAGGRVSMAGLAASLDF